MNQKAQAINNAEIATKDAEEAVAMGDKVKALTALESAALLYSLCDETEKWEATLDKLAKARTTMK